MSETLHCALSGSLSGYQEKPIPWPLPTAEAMASATRTITGSLTLQCTMGGAYGRNRGRAIPRVGEALKYPPFW